jgi:hypothetical protein
MPSKENELKEVLRLGIKTLILQEVRLLCLERTFTPQIVIDEMSQSIQNTKKEISKLAKSLSQKERATLLKRMIRKAVDEEIDRAIELRKTRCIRCLHGRFYDEAGTAYVNLPVNTRIETIGCDQLRPNLRKTCKRFVEISLGHSLEDYLGEMTLLYEFRDMINQIEEVWGDYLTL